MLKTANDVDCRPHLCRPPAGSWVIAAVLQSPPTPQPGTVTMATATPASTERFRLGEGPVWDAPRDRLLWVDIEGRAVLQGVLDGGAVTVSGRIGFDTMVGAVAVAE